MKDACVSHLVLKVTTGALYS